MEQQISVGDLIKGFDFQPMPGRNDRFVVGVVRQIGPVCDEGYDAYHIDCVYDSNDALPDAHAERSRVRMRVFVPIRTTFDYDGRVTRV